MIRENPFAHIYMQCNNGTNQEKFAWIEGGIVTNPKYIDIELTNNCNFNCCFCPTGTKAMNRQKGFMEMKTVDVIIDSMKKYDIFGARFIRWGEPTMHPHYIEIVKKFKEAGRIVHINTNGSLITDEQIKELINIGLDSIKFSFQGADEGTYNEMRLGGDYKFLLDRISKMVKLRGSSSVPYIQVSTTLTGETLEQIENFKHDIQGICDYYNIGYTQLSHLNIDEMKIDEYEKQKIRELCNRETLHKTYTEICPEAYDKLSINWNGDVTICCSDYDNFLLVGNVLDNDLHQLFNSHAAHNYRKVIAKHQYGALPLCRTCYSTIDGIK